MLYVCHRGQDIHVAESIYLDEHNTHTQGDYPKPFFFFVHNTIGEVDKALKHQLISGGPYVK